MARYRRSPTCSHCWGRGHTKRSCPEMKTKAAEWLKKNEHLKGTDQYPSRPWYVRQVEEYAESVKNRQCSWCGEKGHNKRGCQQRKGAQSKNISKNKEWRAEVLERLKKDGYGVGALLERSDRPEHLYMITDMNWDRLNLTGSSHDSVPRYDYSKSNYKEGMQYPNLIISRVKDARKTTAYYPQLTNEKGEELLHYGRSHWKVVSSTEPSPPDGWVNDESWANGLF